jgi:hypothetical protein
MDRKTKEPKKVKSFRPSPQVEKMLQKAKQRTGRTETWIIERSIIFALSQKGVIQ